MHSFCLNGITRNSKYFCFSEGAPPTLHILVSVLFNAPDSSVNQLINNAEWSIFGVSDKSGTSESGSVVWGPP